MSARRLALLCLALAAAACEPGTEPGSEYFPDMARDPAYKAFAPNPAMRDGRTLQPPVAGTIARGHQPFHYGTGEEEAVRAGRELVNPFKPTADVLDKGRNLFGIYCMVCHGEKGKGDGPIVGKIPTPPSYLSERVMAFPPGRIFHIITKGGARMPSYAAQLAADERWLVVTYVKNVLQGPKGPKGQGGAK